MSQPLIVDFYRRLPQPTPLDDDDLWTAGMQDAMREFRVAVKNNYTEGSLQRLLRNSDSVARQAAVLALGLMGTMASNVTVAAALRDEDAMVRRLAGDALWEIWFRGGDPDHCWQLQQAMQLPDHAQMLAALEDLIETAPDFAEAHNQRAILFFRRGEYARCVADCKATMRLNPHHFAAAAGMGQCYLKLKKPRAALRAFEQALTINPELDDLKEAVQALHEALDE